MLRYVVMLCYDVVLCCYIFTTQSQIGNQVNKNRISLLIICVGLQLSLPLVSFAFC